MKIFAGLEGARGYLACAVVIAHIIVLTAIGAQYQALNYVPIIGDIAVRVFIIISGFVIFHLLTERREPYLPYIARRFFRLYPVYIVCLILGVISTHFSFHILPEKPFGDLLPVGERMISQMQGAEGFGYFAHLILHITMLHGIVSNNVLYESQYFFLSPAWSLSLEWQFYLIAPFVFYATGNKFGVIVTLCLSLASYFAFKYGTFGVFGLPSFLPGAIPLFAIGIASRMLLPQVLLHCRLSSILSLTVGLIVSLLSPSHSEILIWSIIFFYSIGALPLMGNVIRACLDSPVSIWLGARSYALYLVHFPVIQLIMVCSALVGLTYFQMAAATAIFTFPISIMLASLLHKFVEKPGMAFGKTVIARPMAVAV